MNSKVLITIKGIQQEIADNGESIQTIQQGIYKKVADKHVIMYDELPTTDDGSEPVSVKNILKISSDSVTLTKRGGTTTEMFFKEGVQHTGLYEIPYGTLQMSLFTNKLTLEEKADLLDINIDYGLDMNYSHVSDCSIQITIQSV